MHKFIQYVAHLLLEPFSVGGIVEHDIDLNLSLYIFKYSSCVLFTEHPHTYQLLIHSFTG